MRSVSETTSEERELVVVQCALLGIEAREIEHIVDQRQKMGATVANVLGVFVVTGRAERAVKLRQQHIGKADHRVQRGAQFVAHRRQKGGFGAVGDRGLFERGDKIVRQLLQLCFRGFEFENVIAQALGFATAKLAQMMIQNRADKTEHDDEERQRERSAMARVPGATLP